MVLMLDIYLGEKRVLKQDHKFRKPFKSAVYTILSGIV